jgi:Ca2+-binding RTX toxin-like protein
MARIPTTTVEFFGAASTADFFAPSTSAIVSISGTGTKLRVTLQSGVVLEYEGAGLAFAGTRPMGGSVTSVSLLGAADVLLGRLDLAEAPWNFAEIRSSAPWQSYAASRHTVVDAFGGGTRAFDNILLGGNQADQIFPLDGADIARGFGGDDVFFLTASSGITRPKLAIDGGTGSDQVSVGVSLAALDLRDVTFRSIESLFMTASTLRISGAQIGNGQLAANLGISGGPGGVLQIDQVAGKTVNAALFQFAGPAAAASVWITGTSANDRQIGNDASNDRLEGLGGDDTLNGREGNDTIFGGDGDDRLFAGGTSEPSGPARRDEVYGGAGDDHLFGGSQTYDAELLSGDAGNDVIVGGGFGSNMEGGAGDDLLRATSTTGDFFVTNLMLGGEGNDTLVGSSDFALMYGELGNDVYRINAAELEIGELAGEGVDRVFTAVDLDLSRSGRFGQDAGEIERISVTGLTGRAVTGTASANRIDGNAGADSLSGADGDDQLFGQDGNDILSGGTGSDLLRGGAGADTFIFATGFDRDVIADFTSGADLIDLRGLDTVGSLDDLLANHVRQVGSDVWIDGGAGDVVILRNLSVSVLGADDFLF